MKKKKSMVTKWLAEQLKSAYDTDYIDSMDDLIYADDMAEKILGTTYNNADYEWLRGYAKMLQSKAYTEVQERD